MLKSKNMTSLKEGANFMSLGLNYQENKDYIKAKPVMVQGIEKIKHHLIKDETLDKELVFEYYSLFERFLQNVINDEENEKITPSKTLNSVEDNTLKDIYNQYILMKNDAEFDLMTLPLKILQQVGDYIEKGFYFSKNLFVRKEIWFQQNGKIEGLNQKYEVYKTIYEKLDNLMILSRNNVINIENVDKFCNLIVEIQNNFAKDFTFIKPCVVTFKQGTEQTGFYQKFSELSTKFKNNLLSTKLLSKPDYVKVISKMIDKTKDLELIFNNSNLKKIDSEKIKERKLTIYMFFYNTVFKLILQDLRDLTIRFLKKKFLSFENK